MKKGLFIFVLILLNVAAGLAQDTVDYVLIGSKNSEQGVKLIFKTDSTFYALINSGDDDFEANSNIEIWELSEFGEVLKAISIGSAGSDEGINFQVNDSLIMIVGVSNGNAEYYQGAIFLVTEDGKLKKELYNDLNGEWSKYSCIETIGSDRLLAILEATDDNFKSPEFQILNWDAKIIKKYSTSELQGFHFNEIKPSNWGSGFIGCGYINSETKDGFVLRVNKDFEVEWISKMELPGVDVYVSLDEFSDSSIATAAYSDGFFLSDKDIIIEKFDYLGKRLDTLIQGYDQSANNKDDIPTNLFIQNDTIYLTGYTETYGNGEKEAFMTRLTNNLGLVFGSTTFGTTKSEVSNSILKYHDGLIGLGYSEFKTHGLDDVLFWKRSKISSGQTIVKIEYLEYSLSDTAMTIVEVSNNFELGWFQNNREVKITNLEKETMNWTVFDIAGNVLFFGKIGYADLAQFELPNSGMFILHLQSEIKNISIKLVTY